MRKEWKEQKAVVAAVEVAETVAVQSVSGCSCLSVKIVIYFQVDY